MNVWNICPSCRIGRLQKRSMAYIEWYGKNLLVADRMPVQVCDVCGERDYDTEAIESLQQLLWSSAPTRSTRVIPSSRNT